MRQSRRRHTSCASVTLYTLSFSEVPLHETISGFWCSSVLTLSAHGRHHVGVVRVAKRWVYRCGRGEHVSSMAERRQVAHGHVSGQGGGAERGALVMQAFGKLLIAVAAPLALFGFVGHLAVTCLYSLLFHGQRPVHLCTDRERRRRWMTWLRFGDRVQKFKQQNKTKPKTCSYVLVLSGHGWIWFHV